MTWLISTLTLTGVVLELTTAEYRSTGGSTRMEVSIHPALHLLHSYGMLPSILLFGCTGDTESCPSVSKLPLSLNFAANQFRTSCCVQLIHMSALEYLTQLL
jgi:hypothetical protein